MHLSKTAGSSLKSSFSKSMKKKLFLDYKPYNLANNFQGKIRKYILSNPQSIISKVILNYKYRVIHGHFFVDKYKYISPDARFITFFRDPMARSASHYYYWKREPDLNNENCRKMIIEQKLSLQEFCFTPFITDFYKRHLGSFEIDDFTFIGLTEAYYDSIKILNKMLDLNLETTVENQGEIINFQVFSKTWEFMKKSKKEIKIINKLMIKLVVNLKNCAVNIYSLS